MNLDIRTKKTIEEGIISGIILLDKTGAVTYCSYAPGNGTQYNLIFTNITGVDDVGDQGGWLVTWINSHDLKAMVVTDNGGLLHWQYVMEKMRASISDAVCLAEIISHCTGRTYITCEEIAQQPEDIFDRTYSDESIGPAPEGLYCVFCEPRIFSGFSSSEVWAGSKPKSYEGAVKEADSRNRKDPNHHYYARPVR